MAVEWGREGEQIGRICCLKGCNDCSELKGVVLKPSNIGNDIGRENSKRLFQCAQCDASFHFESELTKHLTAHFPRCLVCRKYFSSAAKLNLHKLRERHFPLHSHNIGLLSQPASSSDTNVLAKTDAFSCSVCGRTFANRGALVRHHVVVHDRRPHPCSNCGKNFRTRQTVETHKCRRKVNCTCVVCGKIFFSTRGLTLHRHSDHSEEKPFSCLKCGIHFRLGLEAEIHVCPRQK